MIIYIDMDDVLCDFTGAYQQALAENPAIQFPQSQYGFFTNLEPIEGGVESIKAMIASDNYNPYILTAPSTKNPLCYTEKRVWIEKYFGMDFVEKLIISPNKGLLKGDILIDDQIKGKGQERFEGRLIHFGSERFPNWESICVELELLV